MFVTHQKQAKSKVLGYKDRSNTSYKGSEAELVSLCWRLLSSVDVVSEDMVA